MPLTSSALEKMSLFSSAKPLYFLHPCVIIIIKSFLQLDRIPALTPLKKFTIVLRLERRVSVCGLLFAKGRRPLTVLQQQQKILSPSEKFILYVSARNTQRSYLGK